MAKHPYIPQDERTELTNKEKIIRRVVVVILIILMLIPQKVCYKDGGTVEYRAILYAITKHHVMVEFGSEEQPVHTYFINKEIEILGFTIYENPTYEEFEKECEKKYSFNLSN